MARLSFCSGRPWRSERGRRTSDGRNEGTDTSGLVATVTISLSPFRAMTNANELFRKRGFLRLLMLSVVLVLLYAFTPPWSCINSRTEEVDIRSGQTRYTRFLFCTPVSQRIESSPVSEVVGTSGGDP